MNRLRLLIGLAISGMLLASISGTSATERFGDIVISPQVLVSGETYHGYREFRVLLENQSLKDTHQVTLTFPERAFGYGNSVSRISRTVSLAPLSRATVPLWQPPLPMDGDGRLRVSIDDDRPEVIGMPGGGMQHMTRSGSRFGGGPLPAVVLVSRSLNFEEISRAVGANQTGLSAALATGAPDSGGRRGMINTAWMPEASTPGPHWLELDYEPPLRANSVRIYYTIASPASGEVILTGTSGTNLATIPMSASTASLPRGRMTMSAQLGEFSFPLTSEPVKTVRLNFGSVYPGSISVDAVELVGPSGSAWASSARASSEASLTSPAASGMTGVETRRMLRSELPVAEWSEAWLSYTPYDAVAVNAADLKAMPPAVLTALWRYTECGGTLLLMGGGDVPESWRLFPEALEGGHRFSAGFGQCFVFEKERISELKPPALKSITDALNGSIRSWQSLSDESSANVSFPVIENVRVPVRGIVFIMLAFVLAIGPVNLIVLSRMNRRTWLLWTIPAISIFTSLIVFAYSMLREGITPDARIEGLTFLDQPGHRAASVGVTAFYCPLTPSQGLFFTSDTEATPLVEMWDYGHGTQREMDWTQSQHLERGWVTARVPAHFRLRKSEVRRERLQLENADGRMTVINGLGAPIRTLWLADDSGKVYSATNIAAGQKANLSAFAGFPKVQERAEPHSLFERLGYTQLTNAFSTLSAPSYLTGGTYIAELETNPFLENGLGAKAKSARTRSAAIVYGILDPPGTPGTGLLK
jgi:hypothetical protein